ncbi:uncharacterized protein CIMG_11151 [Coccidioides immitis RS]|uniref:Uncharacterized protein n=3 Tax=Coccidioides immitis TaxID=5501 RepID=J3KBQ9_COCIM|nr:uncharacterized protein CIMG_11151 [Coccidioides immitis RS]EAS32576.3 hypothetical protein CIMG_11151 [Coccidioides immitis RS]KMP07816.1 hypothetical protein CIRG_07496 [Coccidioides immitis RMSCC 2394]KMU71723.1 hypothetical protein CISG_00034 [Coccidioides immitis RMSCC 3703]
MEIFTLYHQMRISAYDLSSLESESHFRDGLAVTSPFARGTMFHFRSPRVTMGHRRNWNTTIARHGRYRVTTGVKGLLSTRAMPLTLKADAIFDRLLSQLVFSQLPCCGKFGSLFEILGIQKASLIDERRRVEFLQERCSYQEIFLLME